MSFTNLAKKRCSIRAYDPGPVEPDKIAAIVEAGGPSRRAPRIASPCASSRWKRAEGLADLGRYANLYSAPLAFIVCADAGALGSAPSTAWSPPSTPPSPATA